MSWESNIPGMQACTDEKASVFATPVPTFAVRVPTQSRVIRENRFSFFSKPPPPPNKKINNATTKTTGKKQRFRGIFNYSIFNKDRRGKKIESFLFSRREISNNRYS